MRRLYAIKRGALALLLTGGTLLTTCNWTDVRRNIIAGTLDFVSAYTAETLDRLTPLLPDLFPEAEA